MSRLSPVATAVLVALFHAAPAGSAQPQELPEPRQGQVGKDVIWLPTPESLVERMLTMAQVGPRDVVYDLGSGDGRMVIAAAKRGAQAIGVEFNPELVAFSESRARGQGVARKARFIRGDIFETDFSDTMRLRPTLLKMSPGTRVVSHAFTMDDWAPDEVSRAEQRTAYLWIVPAAVEGSWRVDLQGGRSFDVALVQRFQKVEGTVALGMVEASLRETVLRGDTIRFCFVDQDGVWHELTGTVLRRAHVRHVRGHRQERRLDGHTALRLDQGARVQPLQRLLASGCRSRRADGPPLHRGPDQGSAVRGRAPGHHRPRRPHRLSRHADAARVPRQRREAPVARPDLPGGRRLRGLRARRSARGGRCVPRPR
jgi:SAM-dependent methyltransferase